MDVIILVSLPLINCIKILQTNGSSGLLELQLRGRGGGFGGMVFCPKPYGLGLYVSLSLLQYKNALI